MWNELVRDLRLRNKDTELALLAGSEAMREKVAEKAEEKVMQSADAPNQEDLEAKAKIIDQTAPTCMDAYNPWILQWFNGPLFPALFAAVSVREAFADSSLLLNPSSLPPKVERDYFPEDTWLCPFLEGWTLNRTVAERAGTTEDAFYFSYNNLSCAGNTKPLTSRLYFWSSPLIPSDQTISRHVNEDPFWIHPTFKLERTESGRWTKLSNTERAWGRFTFGIEPCMGFKCLGSGPSNWNPWPGHLDLSDPVSALFVQSHYGNMGLPFHHSDETIDQSLPSGWVWKRDISGYGHPIYTYLGAEDETLDTTVHPSHFFREDDPFPVRLPRGWHRRLDRDGNLFFVDDNTRSASRLDPRFNRNIDQKTGLLVGWTRTMVRDISSKTNTITPDGATNTEGITANVEDEKTPSPLIPYYHTRIGRTLIGTRWPSSILTKSLDFKDFLSRPPEEGDALVDCIAKAVNGPTSWLSSHHYHISKIADSELPELTPLLRKRYDAIFTSITSALAVAAAAGAGRGGDGPAQATWTEGPGPYRVTYAEAEARCRDSGLPLAVYGPILFEADVNRDGVFTPPEFADMLHRMQEALRKWQKQQSEPAATAYELAEYDRMFARIKDGEEQERDGGLDISIAQATAAAERVYYDEGIRIFAKNMWKEKDMDPKAGRKTGIFDIVQFGEGMHTLRVEMARRKDLAIVGGDPVQEWPVDSNAGAAVEQAADAANLIDAGRMFEPSVQQEVASGAQNPGEAPLETDTSVVNLVAQHTAQATLV